MALTSVRAIVVCVVVDLLVSMCKFIQLYKITKQLGTDWLFSAQEALSSILGTRKNDKSFIRQVFLF